MAAEPLLDAQGMEAHVHLLCEEHGIQAIRTEGWWSGKAMRILGRRRIWIQPPTTPARYFVALHEIGHIVDPAGRGLGRRLKFEVAAWRWALAASEVPLTPGVGRTIAEALMTYVWAARRFRGWSLIHQPALEPGSDLWAFLNELDPRYAADHDGEGYEGVWGEPLGERRRRLAGRRAVRRMVLSLAAVTVGAFLTGLGLGMSRRHDLLAQGLTFGGWTIVMAAMVVILLSVFALSFLPLLPERLFRPVARD